MNRQKSIAVFAVIAAVAVTSIGLTGVSATPLIVSSIPQSQEGIGMLGHVEYTLMGDDNQIKAYIQGDNTVVNDGKDCVAGLLFASSVFGNCKDVSSKFNFIAIGNGTGSVGSNFSNLQQMTNATDSNDDGCADSGTQTGELARLAATVTVGAVATGDGGSGTGTQVVLQTAVPFDFVTANATLVNESGIFSGAQATPGSGDDGCGAAGEIGVDWNMFSIQRLNSDNGIAVTDGDSLSVKWTITIG